MHTPLGFLFSMEEHRALNKETDLSIDLSKELEVRHTLEGIKKTLQAIFDGIKDGIFVINREYEIIRANKAVLNMFGKRDFSEILGRKCFNELYQRAAICDNCPAEKTFEDGTSNQLTKISREMGKKMIVLNKSTFPINDDGDVIQVIEYIKDVTHVVKLEDQLLRSEQLSGIGKLAAGIAHEVRNPLSNIKAAVQLCLNKYEIEAQIPAPVLQRLQQGAQGEIADTPKAGDPIFGKIQNLIIASNALAARAAAEKARAFHYHTMLLSTFVEGETREVAKVHDLLDTLLFQPMSQRRAVVRAHPFVRDDI